MKRLIATLAMLVAAFGLTAATPSVDASAAVKPDSCPTDKPLRPRLWNRLAALRSGHVPAAQWIEQQFSQPAPMSEPPKSWEASFVADEIVLHPALVPHHLAPLGTLGERRNRTSSSGR